MPKFGGQFHISMNPVADPVVQSVQGFDPNLQATTQDVKRPSAAEPPLVERLAVFEEPWSSPHEVLCGACGQKKFVDQDGNAFGNPIGNAPHHCTGLDRV